MSESESGPYADHPDGVVHGVLCRVFDPADIAAGEAVIRDFGCGYGALYDHLKGHPVMRGGLRFQPDGLLRP